MASSEIIDVSPVVFNSIDALYDEQAKISETAKYVNVIDKAYETSSIKASNFYNGKVVQGKKIAKVSQRLPFYIRFENIQISGYGPSNPAPIGIAVIGLNNYIL